MKRVWSVGIGMGLALLAATGRADDDVVWKAVPGAKTVAANPPPTPPVPPAREDLDPPPVLKSAGFTAPWRTQTAAPPAEPLGQPRKDGENPIPGPGIWGTGTPPASADGKTSIPPTYNLVGEHCLGEEGPPVDPGRRIWVRGEFLLWWMRPQTAPPLVSTVVPNLVPGALTFTPGALGTPGETTLYGNGPIGGSLLPGGRFSAGIWLDDCQTCGLEARYFFAGPESNRFQLASSPTTPIIARPIYSPNTFGGVPIGNTAQIVAFPPGFTLPGGAVATSQIGTITVDTASNLWGTEFNAREALWICSGCDYGWRVDVFGGFRYVDLQESLRIEEDITLLTADQNGRPPGSVINVVDFFGTHNQFYGGQLGLSGELRRGKWFAEGRVQLAMGETHQTVSIDGYQLYTPPNGTPVFDNRGGLLADRGANIGVFTQDHFSVIPEINLNVGYQLTPRLRAFVGYDFLYWSSVIRPGTEVDPVVDVTRVPNFVPPGLVIAPVNPPRPAVRFQQTDFWAQGMNFGMELKW